MPDRAPGFYRVRTSVRWIVAEYYCSDLADGWNIPGREDVRRDGDFAEIGQRVAPEEDRRLRDLLERIRKVVAHIGISEPSDRDRHYLIFEIDQALDGRLADDVDPDLRRLRAELHRAQEDRDDLTRRLAYADQQIVELRKKLATPLTQAAAPREDRT